MLNEQVRNAILPGASYEDFIEYVDMDGICIHDKTGGAWEYETLDASKKIKRDQWGAIVRFTEQQAGHPIKPAIELQETLDTYVPPDPDLPWRYEPLERALKRFKGQRAVIVYAGDPFAVAKDFILGDVRYFKAMIKNPGLVEQANEIVLNYYLRYVKNCLDLGADIIWVGGDWAMKKGPMVSPELTKRFIGPYFQKIVELAHSRGAPCLKHTDGNVWPIIDVILDAGTDGLHPIDPLAGMDIGDAKTRIGNKLCLMGNVSCVTTLCSGTIEEVRQETKDVIRKAGKGGGLICGSSNSIHSGVRPENYVAMVKAIKEYGKYPLLV
jgi:uroporphyrinogen decarboxylase